MPKDIPIHLIRIYMNIQQIIQKVAQAINISVKQVEAVWNLLEDKATIPFISRYRKEATGGLDEVQIAQIRDEVTNAIELEKRREFILKTIEEQGNLTPELKKLIEKTESLNKLEDIYLPFKPKRRTKATIAKEKGLEPLANVIWDQLSNIVPEKLAEKYINAEKEVNSVEEALEGARHILAEKINETAELRDKIRRLFDKTAVLKSKVIQSKKEEAAKYQDYFEWEEPLAKIPSHRLLAMRRGEKELFLVLDLVVDSEEAEAILGREVIKSQFYKEQLKLAVEDCFKRLMKPSIETEYRLNSKKKADLDAINVFSENLKELLMASPLGEKRILAIDPGFRTGCKVVALNAQGKLEEYQNIFPHEPQRKVAESEMMIKGLVQKYKIEAIAIGNGTAGRETEDFVKKMNLPNVTIVSVNESGASIYSASDVAREEFPDQDVTVRGAVSIGRRLADPLAELVKIDPKSIGVGQYQHDVDQSDLKSKLDEVVMSCVNKVGVDINTASKQLLTYVSGLGPQLAQNIIDYRNENGAFTSRKEINKVARMGAKAYEQAAGFLRIRGAKNPLDTTSVHPESYAIVEQMAKDLKAKVSDLISSPELRKQLDLQKYCTPTIGLPTLKDILSELEKPGRDPRQSFEVFEFSAGVSEIKHLRIGMELNGIVTNVTNFGAFVDVGVHQDGLVHISHLSNTFVSDPKLVVKVNQKVKVTVLEVDAARKRIALSMKTGDASSGKSIAPKTQKLEEKETKATLDMLKGKWGK